MNVRNGSLFEYWTRLRIFCTWFGHVWTPVRPTVSARKKKANRGKGQKGGRSWGWVDEKGGEEGGIAKEKSAAVICLWDCSEAWVTGTVGSYVSTHFLEFCEWAASCHSQEIPSGTSGQGKQGHPRQMGHHRPSQETSIHKENPKNHLIPKNSSRFSLSAQTAGQSFSCLRCSKIGTGIGDGEAGGSVGAGHWRQAQPIFEQSQPERGGNAGWEVEGRKWWAYGGRKE